MHKAVGAALLISAIALARPAVAERLVMTDPEVATASREAVFHPPIISAAAIARLRARGEPDVLPALALAIRYRGPDRDLLDAISALAGETIRDWADLMLWIEGHPEFLAHPSYRQIKLDLLQRVDPNFLRFLDDARSTAENMDIRLEEIVWGGVRVDGIPALESPAMIEAAAADYLLDDDLVFGIAINGDVRAYPLRILGWHEMFNDVIGGQPVALAYCTLCGSAILFETDVEGQEAPLIFGSSGLLYRSNKLMFDRSTDSLWNQFTGKPVTGPLRGSGIELKIRPVVTSTWAEWRARHPETTVLSLETGHSRDYGSGVVYNDYFKSPDLMFPARVASERTARRKDFVFGVKTVGAARAWPVAAFAETPVINDRVGARDLVLIGDAASRSVRAYARDGLTFRKTDRSNVLTDGTAEWRMTEDALIGPADARLARIAGRLGYWFAWSGYFGAESTLYGEDD